MAKAKAKAKAAAKAAPKAPALKAPEKFTLNAMVDSVAAAVELPKKKVKEVVEAYLELVKTGVLKGARVPVGAIGKVFIRIRPATKKRTGRNPLTGETITIPAKPATKVPKVSFAKAFKEEAKKAKLS